MPFSQELKIEAYIRGFKCAEVPIKYRIRSGDTKLHTFRDGTKIIFQLIYKKLSFIFSNTTREKEMQKVNQYLKDQRETLQLEVLSSEHQEVY